MSSTALSPEAPGLRTELRRVFEQQQRHQQAVAGSSARERIAKLRRLHDLLIRRRGDIREALRLDFGKSPTETDLTEIGVINTEIRHAIRRLRAWMRPQRVGMPLVLIGTASEIRYEPKGLCLIMSPWNFPFNLTLAPLVSAVAAGNCVILKPSDFTPHSAALMGEIVAECFPPEEVTLVEGGVEVARALLELPFHHIFFTGSTAVGKLVMEAAARHLASVTLELGGKSPVVVDETADLDTAAAKIAWVKTLNAGQICIAPDYVLVHQRVHDALVERMTAKLRQFYGERAEDRQRSPDYCRIVEHRHFDRVEGLLRDAVERGAQLAGGGSSDRATRFIDPAVLTRVPEEAAIWREEIFGPLLLVRPFDTLDGAIEHINAGERPLAMYIFSASRQNVEKLLSETRSGGVTVNDCGAHFYNSNLPFGGTGHSGFGKSHGRFGFEAFSNARSVVYQNRLFPHTNLFLPPYNRGLGRWLLEGVVRWF
jgi:aldehyde dehydrogenase (NAD+)